MKRSLYTVPKARISPLALENNYLASQLEDYPDNPIFGQTPLSDSDPDSE